MSAMRFRGTAVIIVNKDFPGPNRERRGADKDYDMMKEMFRELGFKVKDYQNIGALEMKTVIEKAREWDESYEPECFACVISTHGREDDIDSVKQSKTTGVYSRNIMPGVCGADDGFMTIDDVTGAFVKVESAFTGKPKLFFIQACRSRKETPEVEWFDRGVINPNEQGDGPNGGNPGGLDSTDDASLDVSGKDETGSLSRAFVDVRIGDGAKYHPADTNVDTAHGRDRGMPMPCDVAHFECPKDCLIMQPISSGKAALRHPRLGSFMLYYMHQNRQLLLDKWSLLQYLTKVSQDMANTDIRRGDGPIKMCNTITHRLEQDVKF